MAQAQMIYRFPPICRAGMVSKLLIAGVDGLLTWQRRSRERAELAELSDAYLKDIGLSRIDALREARKPFWRE